MISLKLVQISTFLTVAETSSFRDAAERLNISQSTVSARIRLLEEALGVRLFQRTTRAVSLTHEGERLVVTAKQTLRELESLTQQLQEEGALDRGRFTVAALPSVAATILPVAIEAFRRRHPNISVQVIDCVADRAVSAVLSGDVEFALTSPARSKRDLRFEHLFRDECLVVVPRTHALAEKDTITLHELAECPLLLPVRGAAFRATIDATFSDHGIPLHGEREAINLTTLMAYAEAGMGLTFVPSIFVQRLDLSLCRTLRLRPNSIWREIGAVTLEGRLLSPAADAFMTFLRSWLGKSRPAIEPAGA